MIGVGSRRNLTPAIGHPSPSRRGPGAGGATHRNDCQRLKRIRYDPLLSGWEERVVGIHERAQVGEA